MSRVRGITFYKISIIDTATHAASINLESSGSQKIGTNILPVPECPKLGDHSGD